MVWLIFAYGFIGFVNSASPTVSCTEVQTYSVKVVVMRCSECAVDSLLSVETNGRNHDNIVSSLYSIFVGILSISMGVMTAHSCRRRISNTGKNLV